METVYFFRQIREVILFYPDYASFFILILSLPLLFRQLLVGFDGAREDLLAGHRLDVDLAALVVAHVLTLADGPVVGVAGEAATGGVELLSIDFEAEVAGGGEFEFKTGWQRAHLVFALVGVVALPLWYLDDGEGAEGLDGHTEGSLGELKTYLVEDVGQHRFYGGPTDAAALDNVGGEGLEVGFWFHGVCAAWPQFNV